MLLDANLLLYAIHREARHHERTCAWLTEQLNGAHRVGLPWQSLGGFLRVATNPRALPDPLPPAVAWRQVDEWLAAPAAWVPAPGPAHGELLGGLIERHEVAANLIPDAMLAALALEHGLAVCSADTDFARFEPAGLRWHNPLTG
ncbi:MAG: TA system VapC family ribonuclease toxin [Chloroflexota bacterium]